MLVKQLQSLFKPFTDRAFPITFTHVIGIEYLIHVHFFAVSGHLNVSDAAQGALITFAFLDSFRDHKTKSMFSEPCSKMFDLIRIRGYQKCVALLVRACHTVHKG